MTGAPADPAYPQNSTTEDSKAVHAFMAGFLGWTLDAFDFFVLVFVLPSIAHEFHRSIADIAYSITLTLAMRPVGALIFGWAADRYGRRVPLMVDVIFYSVVEVLSGLAPGYRSFLLLRALYGIGMGGEWGVGASLVMESVPPHRRGLLSGLLQEGYSTGYLLAAAAYFFVFPHWGWRPLFVLGGAPALLALYIRSHVPESKAWQHVKPDPRQILRAIKNNFGSLLYLVLLMTLMSMVSHGTQDIYPTFLERERGFGPREVAIIAVIYNIGALGGGLCFGLLSDRLGRRRAMIGALLLGLLMVPMWVYASWIVLLVTGAFLMQFMVQGAFGVIPAHLTEMSPNEARGLFPGLAYHMGVLISSGVPYFEAILGKRFGYGNALAIAAAFAFSSSALVIALGHERHRAEFHPPAKT
jgi:SHS family lactate transporter-like MFS transporter